MPASANPRSTRCASSRAEAGVGSRCSSDRLWANARILRFAPEQELRWTAHFLSPSVFNGEHYFAIAQPSGSQCLFQHGEIFTGVTLPIAWPIIRAYGQQIYGSLNEALKRRAEM